MAEQTKGEAAGFDLDAFSAENRVRCEAPHGFNHPLQSWSISDWMTAVLGELGEAANVAKKLNRVRDGVRGNRETEAELRVKLASELADAFIYLDLLAQSQGLRLSDIVRRTFDAKSVHIGYVTSQTQGSGAGVRVAPERARVDEVHEEPEPRQATSSAPALSTLAQDLQAVREFLRIAKRSTVAYDNAVAALDRIATLETSETARG